MNDQPTNHVRETPRPFSFGTTAGSAPLPTRSASVSMRVKIFKSGNSLALRLPAALGLEAGMEMELTTEMDGSYTLRVAPPARRTIDISGFAGKAPGIRLAPREDFDERPSTIAAREAAART
jgi:antitoxin VapB